MHAPINVKVAQRRHPYALLPPGEGGAQRRMREAGIPVRQTIRQMAGAQADVLAEVLRDPVNLAIWQRRLPAPIGAFAGRLRALDKAMCPRFHVDQVPLRLITSYAGVGSQWLGEGAMARRRLGDPAAEPTDAALSECGAAGHVLLAKGERWPGNEGAG